MKFSIVMPAYNEEKRIGRTLEDYSSFFEKIRKRDKFEYEILVVINNTKDNTAGVVEIYQKTNPRIRYIELTKGGKGYAVIEGFKDALKKENKLIGFVDADGATPPEAYYDLIKNIGNSDSILASRYLKGAKLYPPMTFRRVVVGKIFHFIVKCLFFMPIEDTQCGAKVFSRVATEILVKRVGMTQWAFDIEMLYELKRRGMKIKEIPTIWKEVEGSKLNILKTSIQMFMAVVQLRLVKSPFKKLLKPMKYPVVGLWRLLR